MVLSSWSLVRPSLVLVAVTLTAPVIASQPVPGLIFNAVQRGFGSQMYVAPPGGGSRFVSFQGEPLAIDIEIVNTTTASQRVDTTAIPAAGAFRLISRDGRQQSADLMLSTTGHVQRARVGGRPTPVAWGTVLDLEPGSGVTWHVTLETQGEPGIYRWEIRPPMLTSVPLAMNSSLLDYELRAVSTFADRAELRRRKMALAAIAEDPSTERAALDLLAFYPESHEAHVTLAQLYRDKGRKRDARRHYDAAIRLLQDKRDRLYLEHFQRTMHYTDPIPSLRSERDEVR